MRLTDIKIRKAIIQEKEYKIFDGQGLFILILSFGSKVWRYKYLFAGKEKAYFFGEVSEVTLAKAREKHFEARS
jgi:hypothetical protein